MLTSWGVAHSHDSKGGSMVATSSTPPPNAPAQRTSAGRAFHRQFAALRTFTGQITAVTTIMLDHAGAENLEGKIVTIVGDITHSRVFGSLVRLLKMLKAQVRIAAPRTLIPKDVEKFGVTYFDKVDEALAGADFVYALRVQSERGANGFIPSLREYSKMFGISRKRLDLANKNAILMHPGPVIRDIDVHSALAAVDEQSHILRQVENGMAVRKALLWLLCDRVDGKVKEFARK